MDSDEVTAGSTSKPADDGNGDDLDRQAEAETDAGEGVPVEDVKVWIESWDTPGEFSTPSMVLPGEGADSCW